MSKIKVDRTEDLWGGDGEHTLDISFEVDIAGCWTGIFHPICAAWMLRPYTVVSPDKAWDLFSPLKLMGEGGIEVITVPAYTYRGAIPRNANAKILDEHITSRLAQIASHVKFKIKQREFKYTVDGQWTSYFTDRMFVRETRKEKRINRKTKLPGIVDAIFSKNITVQHSLLRGGSLKVSYWLARECRSEPWVNDTEGEEGVVYTPDPNGRQMVCMTPYQLILILGDTRIIRSERMADGAAVNLLGPLMIMRGTDGYVYPLDAQTPVPGELPADALKRRLVEILDGQIAAVNTLRRAKKPNQVTHATVVLDRGPMPEEQPILTRDSQMQPELDLTTKEETPEPAPAAPVADKPEPRPESKPVEKEHKCCRQARPEDSETKKMLAEILAEVKEINKPKTMSVTITNAEGGSAADREHVAKLEQENADMKKACDQAWDREQRLKKKLYMKNEDIAEEKCEETIYNIEHDIGIDNAYMRLVPKEIWNKKLVSASRIAKDLGIGTGPQAARELHDDLERWGIMERRNRSPKSNTTIVQPASMYLQIQVGTSGQVFEPLGYTLDIVIPHKYHPEEVKEHWIYSSFGAEWIKAEWRRRKALEAKTK